MTLAVVLPVVDHVMSDTVGLPQPPRSNVRNDRPDHHHHVDDDDDPDHHHDWFLLHSTKNMCRACRSVTSIRIDWSQGDRICTACGVVQEERICDRNPEWRDYGDRDDHNNNNNDIGGCHRARSGMIPTDESKYIGGLQPTTLSRSVYQGSNGVGKVVSNSSSSSSFTPNIVQRLRKVHRKIENGIQNKSKVAMKEATWNLQSLKKKRHHHNLERRPRDTTITGGGDADTEQTDTVTATLEDPNDDDDDDLPDYGSHVEWTEERVGTTRMMTTTKTTSKQISDYEHLVQEQERLVLQQRQALYASKWSLDRAKLLFESRTTTHSHHHHLDQSMEDIEKDPVLYQAAHDLFAGYTMICHACTKLHLSMAVMDEAAALLSQYAARRDGLKVRGIATTTTSSSNTVIPTSSTNHNKHNALMITKRWGRPNQTTRTITNHSNHHPSSSHRDKTEFELQEDKEAIRQMNQVRQMASLCAGIVFWIARYRNKPRTIMAVCDSMDDKVSKKMLSRALQELKQIVPELARLPAATATTTTAPSLLFSLPPPTHISNTTVPAAICVQQNHHHHQQQSIQQQQRSTVSNHSSSIDVSAIESIVNIIEHALQKLHLPPVAEASVRYLVLHPCFSPSNDIAPTTTMPSHQFHHAATLAKNVPVQCAALTYLITMVGRTMQQLAKQAHDNDQQKHKRNHPNKRLANISHSDMENKKIKRTMPSQDDDTDEAQLSDNLMSFDLFADNVPMDKSTPDSFDITGQHAQISTPTSSSSSSSSSMVLAEHRAYEMRRMWDAWSEQLPWDRSLTQIEQSTKVASKNVVEYYKQHVHPHRFMLLETLRDSMKGTDSLKVGTPHAMYLAQEGSIMRKTPLSSVLLSNILVAAPLLKNDMKI